MACEHGEFGLYFDTNPAQKSTRVMLLFLWGVKNYIGLESELFHRLIFLAFFIARRKALHAFISSALTSLVGMKLALRLSCAVFRPIIAARSRSSDARTSPAAASAFLFPKFSGRRPNRLLYLVSLFACRDLAK
jgi:hypothetical protein